MSCFLSKLIDGGFLLCGFTIGFAISNIFIYIILNCSDPNSATFENLKQPENRLIKSKNENDNFILIGVITAKNLLETRAKSTYATWGKQVTGQIIFFSRSNFWGKTSDLPVVNLPGTDDAYPPQKKSFKMLKYMYENYLDKYEWFMRADDDVYIKPDKLEAFLRRLNSSIALFIGQPGFGTKNEFGRLSLKEHESFCMGGPGMVISRETLRRIGPYIEECYKSLTFSFHEDVEIGRCINRFAKIGCTLSYEVFTNFEFLFKKMFIFK